MSSQAPRTHETIDITELGFEPPASAGIDILVEERADGGTFVEATYADDVWTLQFDEHGRLTEGATFAAPGFLGPAIEKAAPQLTVT